LHQLLGKNLARLNLSGFLSRTKDGNTPDDELVNNALSQGRFRTNNSKVNSLFPGYFSQRLYISWAKSKVLGNFSRASITRSGIDFLNLWALG
jgi:hypothetical protein